MKIRVQKGTVLTGEVVDVDDITYVICFSNDGEPLVVIEQVGQETVQVTHAGEKSFGHILDRFGPRELTGVTP